MNFAIWIAALFYSSYRLMILPRSSDPIIIQCIVTVCVSSDLTWGDRSTGTFPSATFLLQTSSANRTTELLHPKSSFTRQTSGSTLLQPCLSASQQDTPLQPKSSFTHQTSGSTLLKPDTLLQPKSSFTRQTSGSNLLKPCLSASQQDAPVQPKSFTQQTSATRLLQPCLSGKDHESVLQPKGSFKQQTSAAGLTGMLTGSHTKTGTLPPPGSSGPLSLSAASTSQSSVTQTAAISSSSLLANQSNLTGDLLQPKYSFTRTEELLKPKDSVTLTPALLQSRPSGSAQCAGTLNMTSEPVRKEAQDKLEPGHLQNKYTQ